MNEPSNYFKKSQIMNKPDNTDMLRKIGILSQNYSLSIHDGKVFENWKVVNEEMGVAGDSQENPEELLKTKISEHIYQVLSEHYRNVALLLGAGASIQLGNCRKEAPKAMTREELWNECKNEVDAAKSMFKEDKVLNNINDDIEEFLSRLELLIKVHNKGSEEKAGIEQKIKKACKLELGDGAPHIDLIKKLIARKPSEPRVKIFTTNYDTLIEQAGIRSGCTIIDGFSFSFPRYFSGTFFDLDIVNREQSRLKNEESFIHSVFHLYKLHGSLDWEKSDGQIIQGTSDTNSLIVYPASNKFESSFEQPYFEMMSRFQLELRKDSLILIVAGFGFADKHIQNVIIEAVHKNPGMQLLIFDYNKEKAIDTQKYENLGLLYKVDELFDGQIIYKTCPNVTIIESDFRTFVDNIPYNITYEEKREYDGFIQR